MAKWISLFIVSVLLLRVAVGRSLLSSNNISADSSSHENTRLNDDGEDDSCKGLDKTKCLVRKTMLAHTDYVYTQDLNGP